MKARAMNFHALIDHYTVVTGALLMGKRKFFSRSVDSPSVDELMERIRLELPEIVGEGIYEVKASTPGGELDPAFYVAQWLGADYPTLIYHHGNNERPFDFGALSKNTFNNIVLKHKADFPANLIAMRAPYHQSLKVYMDKVSELDNFSTMLAVSVKLVETLQAWSRAQGSQQIVVSGISLGGWVTNMHRAFFNSADLYVPMLAGAALDEVFLSSAYHRMTGDLALRNPGKVRQALNFEAAFDRVRTDNLMPVLARHDAIIVYERQQRAYDSSVVEVIDKGHTTTVLDDNALRSVLLSGIRQRLRQVTG